MSTKNIFESLYRRALSHPKLLYPLHVLILPKISMASLVEAPNDTPDLYFDLFEVIKILIEKFNFENCDYRLITNGGPNQSVPQWHWHLISENFGEISD